MNPWTARVLDRLRAMLNAREIAAERYARLVYLVLGEGYGR